MASYLNVLRHRWTLCFRERKEDGAGGWTFAHPQEIQVWGAVSPLHTAISETPRKGSLQATSDPIFLKGERYEVVVRAQDVLPHLEKSLAWIEFGKKQIVPLNLLHEADDRQRYFSVQGMVRAVPKTFVA